MLLLAMNGGGVPKKAEECQRSVQFCVVIGGSVAAVADHAGAHRKV